MVSGYRTEEELVQNMADAGCGEDAAAEILTCIKQEQKKNGLLLLYAQRKEMLDKIHRLQECIRFLDDVSRRLKNNFAALEKT